MSAQLILSLAEMARLTGGVWCNVPRQGLELTGACVKLDRVKQGDLAFLTTAAQWGRNAPDTFPRWKEFMAAGASAFVVTPDQASQLDVPVLRVDNTRVALEQLGLGARNASNAIRVLITGTQGKTGFKLLLGQLIERQQRSVNYSRVSANLDVPILRSLASLKDDQGICLVEVAVSEPSVGARRSSYIQPHVCVFTNANPCHIGTHGNIERMLKHKASVVSSIQANGTVLINRESFFYPQLRAAILQCRSDVQILTWGRHAQCDARLLSASFQDGAWHVESNVRGEACRYQLAQVNSHAPTSTLGALLMMNVLGLDVGKAASDISSVTYNFESTGHVFHLTHPTGPFVFYDQHYSNNEYALCSAIDDVDRIPAPGKKIAILGAFNDHVRFGEGAYLRVARRLARSTLDRLYTYGASIRCLSRHLSGTSLQPTHLDTVDGVIETVMRVVQGGDVLLIKAQGAAGFSKVSDAILQHYQPVPNLE